MTEEYELSDMSSNKGFTGIWVNPEGIVDERFSKQNNQNLKGLGMNQFVAFLFLGYTVFELNDRADFRTLVKLDWSKDLMYLMFEQINSDGIRYFEITSLQISHLKALMEHKPNLPTLNRLVRRIRTYISPLEYQPSSLMTINRENDLNYNSKRARNQIPLIFEPKGIIEAIKMISNTVEA